ncbi:porin [Agaribacterium haliotis]|uniref:porin n=1 Tax=Agaribacterium haliotis TaxID=2013869 RepID=UPI000BB53366|nr:porin [Agaribacterium haliotis]
MKKLAFIPVAMMAAAGAYAEPKLYGKANVSLQNADENDSSVVELKSNASRLGVKGDHAIEDTNLKGVYQMEFEVAVDDGQNSNGETFSQRNIFVGLQGGFGLAKAGKFDTPLKVAQKKIDLFNDLEGDIKHMITRNDNRPSNIVQYSSPKLGDVVGLNAAVIASEEEDVDNGFSGSVTAEFSGVYLAAAYDTGVESEETDVARLVAQWNFAAFQLGALYEMMEVDGGDSNNSWMLSAQYKINNWALKAQGGAADVVKDYDDTTTYSLGVDYKFSKKLKTFAYYTSNDFTGADDGIEGDASYFGLGTELKF